MKKITIKTSNENAAKKLVSNIINNVKKNVYKTWSYEKIILVKDETEYDSIFHNPDQFLEDLTKKVWFIPKISGTNITFNPIKTEGYEVTDAIFSLHTGRLLEMLMTYYYDDFTELTVK